MEITKKTEATNFLELRVFGLMRSGNHAIIEWMLNQHSGHPACFLNNVRHGDHDPFSHFAHRMLYNIHEEIDTEALRVMSKRLLIFSYEDRFELGEQDFLESVFNPAFEANRREYIGQSENILDVMIIRDPFNCFSSRFKMLQTTGPHSGLADHTLIVRNWKAMAKKAIALRDAPEPNKIVVSYNRWVTDRNYRQELSRKLKGTFDDSSREATSEFGGGSSFQLAPLTPRMIIAQRKKLLDRWRYRMLGHYLKRFVAPRAAKMKVFERWKLFVEDEDFKRALRDDEIRQLSEELFGELPGTREFVQTLSGAA